MRRNVWLVARREYLENVRTRSFLVGVLFTPLMILGFMGVSELVERLSAREGKPFVIVDLSVPPGAKPHAPPGAELPTQDASGAARTPPGADLGRRLAAGWSEGERWALEGVIRPAESGDDPAAILERLSSRARDGEIEGFAVLRGDLIAGDGKMQWHTRNVANERLKRRLATSLAEIVRADRYVWYAVSQELVTAIQSPVLDPQDVDVSGRTRGDERARDAAEFIPMIFVYALLIGFSAQAQSLLTSTVEEKSNRLVEVLLSSISPLELMGGKIVGMLGVTFTLFALWTSAGVFIVQQKGWQQLIPGEVFAWFLIYFVVTVFFYSTFIAAIGSAVTELKESQNMMVPVWILVSIPMLLMFFVGQHPDSLWVRVLTYVPFFTPFLMVNRLASAVPPSAVEIVASLVLMAVASAGAVWLAGRIFRVAILLYGKPATPRELWRWLRTG